MVVHYLGEERFPRRRKILTANKNVFDFFFFNNSVAGHFEDGSNLDYGSCGPCEPLSWSPAGNTFTVCNECNANTTFSCDSTTGISTTW